MRINFRRKSMVMVFLFWAGLQSISATRLDSNPFFMEDLHRIHVFFTGKVQNVGFRQTAKQLATEYGLQGWIKNLEDQRVELVAEGTEGNLRGLMDKLRDKFEIEDTEINEERPRGLDQGFKILN
jgi:acylphosphatase